MKNITAVVFLFLVLFQAEVFSQRQITSAKITFEFPSKKVTGNIEGFESNSIIDFENPSNSIFKGSVQAKTLDTNNFLRNLSLRGSKYFNVNDYPKITFESTSIIEQSEDIIVEGILSLKGTSKPITITFNKKGEQLLGSTELYSSDYGIKIKKERKDNLVKVNFAFQLN